MPIYDYLCKPCDRPQQVICDFEEADEQICEICDGPIDRQVSLWAFTPARWGDTHGYFDRGLGMYIENSMHREKVMKEKNLRPVSQKELDDHQQAVHNDGAEHKKKVETFQRVKKETGSFAKAAKAITPYPNPEDTHRNERYEFEKEWKPNLKVITKGDEE
jgi:putative FmdB family regulatory protein